MSPLNFIPKTQTIAPAILICLRRTVLNGEHLLISCKKRQPSGRRGPAPPPPPPPRRALGGVFVRRKRGRGMEGDIYVQTVWAYDLHSCWFHETFTFLSRICVMSFKKTNDGGHFRKPRHFSARSRRAVRAPRVRRFARGVEEALGEQPSLEAAQAPIAEFGVPELGDALPAQPPFLRGRCHLVRSPGLRP